MALATDSEASTSSGEDISLRTPAPPVLTAPDVDIANALTAWLRAVTPNTPLSNTFSAASICVPLCTVFSSFAPSQLSDRDFFPLSEQTSPTHARQLRYNIRRLARALSNWFTSPPSENPSSPQLIPTAANILTSLSDADRPAVADPSTPLALAEAVLCAAVHSPRRDSYIKAVLSLPSPMQDSLAVSIRRTVVEGGPASPARVPLTPASDNDENVPRHSRNSSLDAPSGVALADFKAIAAERDNLRRKLTAADAERARLQDVEDTLRKNLDDASDRLRDLASEKGRLEETLAEKLNALNDVQDSLRLAHVSAEEIDMLRAKAQSAEQLEVSLKRASRRLEEAVALRKDNQDLEAQLAAFRESESRAAKHIEYLEAQLNSSHERAQKLAVLSDGLTRDLDEKNTQVSALMTENGEIKQKLETANKQLEDMLISSCASKGAPTATTHSHKTLEESYRQAAEPSASTSPKSADDGSAVTDGQALSSHTTDASAAESGDNVSDQPIPVEKVKDMVTIMLRDAIGVTVEWNDIVECVAGVTDAMREMDEMAYLRMNAPAMEDPLAPPPRVSAGGPQGFSRHRSQGSHVRASQNSMRSAESGSDVNSRVSMLPDFSTFDAKLKAQSNGLGDEFDHAANFCNVREIPIGEQTDDYSSSYDSEEDEDEDENIDATVNATLPQSAHGPVSMGVVNEPSGNTESIERKSPESGSNRESGMPPSRSLTLTVHEGVSRSTSHSEATSAIARQTRNDLRTLHQAMETMRVERQSSASVTALVAQLDKARGEMVETQQRLQQSEVECANLRRELNILLKEMDSQTYKKKVEEERSMELLSEKERLVGHLQDAVRTKEDEMSSLKNELVDARREIARLTDEKKALEKKVEAAGVIERAQEVELTKLRAKLEANEELTARLNAVVKQTDGLRSQLTRQHESQLHNVTETVRREKQIAEEAREEARRLVEANTNVLQDVRATAQAAALARSQGAETDRTAAARRSSRFAEFWRKLLVRERPTVDFSIPQSVSFNPPGGNVSPRKVTRVRSG